uniref:SLC13/DASS family transporter n=1 Tax=Schlesneria paludicola TaxID=360056 RepID=A0A7C2JZQ7_9PLAN
MSASSSMEEPVPALVSRAGWVLGLVVFAAIALWPTPEGLSPAAQRLAAVTALMGVFWVTQALPMEVTSLLPLVLFPVCGVQSAKTVAGSYFSDSSFLYLGGFLLALGIERWGLHRRMALHIVAFTGIGVRRIVLGFMLATFAISMWISNTASTLLMLPIALALLTSLEHPDDDHGAPTPRRTDPDFAPFGMATMLGLGYAATLGGMATLVGTPTNVVFVAVFQKQFPDGPPLSAAQWMLTWTPCALAFLVMAWLVLTVRLRTPSRLATLDRTFFTQRIRELGPMRVGEWWMLAVFLVTAALWLTRTGFDAGESFRLPGWNVLGDRWLASLGVASPREWINDSTIAMGMAIVMFIIPLRPERGGPLVHLMDWHTASRLPWGILLLFGGGFAIAEACRTTGLAEWMGVWLAASVRGLPTWLIIAVICLLVTFLSEFTSNVATANALLPIVAGLAVALGLDPRLLMLPATLAASCGFMLPIGTPPNAIVFGSGRIRMSQMAGYGLLLDVLGVALIVAATYGLLAPQLRIDLQHPPAWSVAK